jgi:predicted RNA-binding protein associated with RNAse of E/G family
MFRKDKTVLVHWDMQRQAYVDIDASQQTGFGVVIYLKLFIDELAFGTELQVEGTNSPLDELVPGGQLRVLLVLLVKMVVGFL